MKYLLLLLDSITLKGKAPPSPPQNSNSLPSTLTEAYIITPGKRRTKRATQNDRETREPEKAENPEKSEQPRTTQPHLPHQKTCRRILSRKPEKNEISGESPVAGKVAGGENSG